MTKGSVAAARPTVGADAGIVRVQELMNPRSALADGPGAAIPAGPLEVVVKQFRHGETRDRLQAEGLLERVAPRVEQLQRDEPARDPARPIPLGGAAAGLAPWRASRAGGGQDADRRRRDGASRAGRAA